MTFGEKLQALRKARGWSQEGLATQINVSRQALSKWESGVSQS
jgi:transcriptional regulator with XRE-family HTH domain